jgi:catechol 2,3-dioxygenase-like lactoylglutathione lyase family enzyme
LTAARLVGINHVALEVGNIDEALAFYGSLFEISLRGRVRGMAFVDMGDQFLALSRAGRSRRTHAAISASSWTTRPPFVPRSRRRA